MAEPLSIAASIIALLQAGGALAQGLQKIYDVKNGLSDITGNLKRIRMGLKEVHDRLLQAMVLANFVALQTHSCEISIRANATITESPSPPIPAVPEPLVPGQQMLLGTPASQEASEVAIINYPRTRPPCPNTDKADIASSQHQANNTFSVSVKWKSQCATTTCRCSCHRRKFVQWPSLLPALTGSISANYTTLPWLSSACDQLGCSRQRPALEMSCSFPYWLWNRVIVARVVQNTVDLDLKLQMHFPVAWTMMIEFLRSPRTESSMYHRFKAYIESNPQALRYMNERVGRTLLHYTIKKVGRRYGERQCVRLLLEKGADLMRGDYAGRNSLHELCLSGKEGAPDLRDLQHVYVDSDSIDPADLGMSDLGGSILELPLTFSVTEALLHADPTSLDELDLRGMTALSWACRIGQVDQVRNLLVHGANANGNVHGSRFTAPAYQSVFYQAYYASTCREILTLLFDHGAALGSQYKDGTNVDIFHTLLELAIEHDMMDFTDDTEWIHNIALKHGANINAVDSHGDHLLSRLRTAARFHRRYMDWVLKSGCSTDYDRIGFRKSLASAMVYRNNEFIKYLVERSVNIQDAADRYGETALHKAAQWTVGDLNTLILARDLSVEVDVHAFNNDGYTAYDIAKCQSTCPFEEIRESDTCSRSDYHCFAGLPYGKGQQAYGQAWFKVFCDFQDEWEAQYNLATKRRMLEGELLDAPLNIPGAFPD